MLEEIGNTNRRCILLIDDISGGIGQLQRAHEYSRKLIKSFILEVEVMMRETQIMRGAFTVTFAEKPQFFVNHPSNANHIWYEIKGSN